MSSPGLIWTLLVLFLLGGVTYLLWRQESDAIEADTQSKASHAADAPGPALIGQAAPAVVATDPATGPESVVSNEPLAAEDTWQLDFTIEGAATWQRASFVPLHKGIRTSVTGGAASGTKGSLQVSGSGRLVIRAFQRRCWISQVLQRPPSGRMTVPALLDAGMAVSGVVVGPDGETPVTDGFVLIKQDTPVDAVPSGFGVNFRVPLDGKGAFRVTGFHPGRVSLHADGAPRGSHTRVQTQAGEELTIRLRPHGVVNLQLVDAVTRATPDVELVRIRYASVSGNERTSLTHVGGRGLLFHREGQPALVRLDRVLCGKPFTVKIRAHGYASTDVDVELPAFGGEKTLEVALEKDASTATVLHAILRSTDGDLPPKVCVGRQAGQSVSSIHVPITNGELRLRLDPEVTQVTIGSAHLMSEWAAVTIPINDANHGTTIRREITLAQGGWLRFPNRPPSQIVTLERDGVRFTRGASDLAGLLTLHALQPGTWKYRIEGANEIWTGEAVIRAGDTTTADPRIETKDAMAAPTPVVPR